MMRAIAAMRQRLAQQVGNAMSTPHNKNPIRDKPCCRFATLCIAFPLVYQSANPTEGKTGNIVPVPPDQKCLAADMIVRHEAPIPAVFAVVAIVAHHEVL